MNGHRSTAARALTSALAAIAAASCAGTTVKTDRDPRVDLSDYRTFDVKTGQVLVNGVPDTRDTLVRDRVESALERELREKGLAKTEQNPDLIATYSAGARTVTEYDDYYDANYGGTRTGGTWAYESTDGTLLIDLIDPTTNKLVWRSIVEMDSTDDLRSAKEISSAVDKGLEKYPGP
jgi:hypothetical protein